LQLDGNFDIISKSAACGVGRAENYDSLKLRSVKPIDFRVENMGIGPKCEHPQVHLIRELLVEVIEKLKGFAARSTEVDGYYPKYPVASSQKRPKRLGDQSQTGRTYKGD
jgi:hypothetical protein